MWAYGSPPASAQLMPAAMKTISASGTRADAGVDVCERPGVLSDANAAAVKTVRSATALVTKSA